MHQMKLAGTYSEMGIIQGQIIRSTGLQFPRPDPRMAELTQGCLSQLEKHAPELFEEMTHLTGSVGDQCDALTALMVTAPLSQTVPSCSIVAVLPERSEDGKLWVGRNYDYFYIPAKQAATTYLTYPEGGFASLGNSDIWVGRSDGLNEAGLFIGMTATFHPGVKPGLTFWFILRMILDHCQSVEEAVQLMESVPHAQSRNYLLADRSGKAVVVEATVDGISLRSPEDGILAVTNHCECPELKGREMFAPPDSTMRYQRLRKLTEKPSVTPEDIKEALSDRTTCVCAHSELFGQAFGTIWSLVGLPERRLLAIADGVPAGEMDYSVVTF